MEIIGLSGILKTLDNFHPNIKFTHELKNDGQLPFLDIMVMRGEDDIETMIYRKPTNNEIYLHWNSFTPVSWRIRTLKSLVLRAYKSTADYRKMELKHLTETFCNNGYPLVIIKNTMEKIEDGILSDRKDDNESDRQVLLTLPYKGPECAS